MQIAMVVPRLYPAVDGVGDYAHLLAKQLRQVYSIETHFIVGDPKWHGVTVMEGFQVEQVWERSKEALASVLQNVKSSTLLLHYVGYGYATRGCPTWLIDGVEQWLKHDNRNRLVTFFHEIYAFGPPWSSSFWLSPSQRHLGSRLAKLSQVLLTSRQSYARLLSSLSQHKPAGIVTLPVFSNVGEPQSLPRLRERQRRMVVFGNPDAKRRVYQRSATKLTRVCLALALNEICDIGTPTGLGRANLNGIPIREQGILDADEISSILQDSIAGFLAFPPPDYLAKSTIFAAYCAHGVLPIHPDRTTTSVDGITSGKTYWVADDTAVSALAVRAQDIADCAHSWYQTHELAAQSAVFARHLLEVSKRTQ